MNLVGEFSDYQTIWWHHGGPRWSRSGDVSLGRADHPEADRPALPCSGQASGKRPSAPCIFWSGWKSLPTICMHAGHRHADDGEHDRKPHPNPSRGVRLCDGCVRPQRCRDALRSALVAPLSHCLTSNQYFVPAAESAAGKFPVESVTMQQLVINKVRLTNRIHRGSFCLNSYTYCQCVLLQCLP